MKPRPVTNLGSIGGAPDPTTVPEVATGMRKLSTDQGNSYLLVLGSYTRTDTNDLAGGARRGKGAMVTSHTCWLVPNLGGSSNGQKVETALSDVLFPRSAPSAPQPRPSRLIPAGTLQVSGA